MIIRKHNHLGNRCIRFVILLFVLISFSIISTHHTEMRIVAKETSEAVTNYNYKAFYKTRNTTSTLRINWSPERISFVIFLLQIVAATPLSASVYRRLSSISILMKRLFLMPIKITSNPL
jgi:hypothetical protein